jgi:DNA polymerase-3 subunit epsilon
MSRTWHLRRHHILYLSSEILTGTLKSEQSKSYACPRAAIVGLLEIDRNCREPEEKSSICSPRAKESVKERAMIENTLNPVAATASRLWKDLTFVGFDTETTGKYPIQAEICEIAGVKWRAGKIIDTFSTLIRPSKPMDAEVIAIHGITNAMVEEAPRMSEKIGEFHAFIQDTVPIAHHAPFDLGFVSIEFEKAGLAIPDQPVLCSSLLSRCLFPESQNHRLQTLVKFFGLAQGTAHRALDDARACLEVAIRCLQKTGENSVMQHAFDAQRGALTWQRFSLACLQKENPIAGSLIEGAKGQKVLEMVYNSGSNPGKPRRIHPIGLVRSLDGDFLVAYDEKDQRSKRYFLDSIGSVTDISS